jgi:hypothetical protein
MKEGMETRPEKFNKNYFLQLFQAGCQTMKIKWRP